MITLDRSLYEDRPESRPLREQVSATVRNLFFEQAEEAEEDLVHPAGRRRGKYYKYEKDPIGWIRDHLGVELSPDVTDLTEAVWEYQYVEAKSGNAVGKTHGAAHIVIAFFLIFEDAQCWLAAAPPESNLKQLLWGEISKIVTNHPDLFPKAEFNIRLAGMSITRRRDPQSFIQGLAIPQSGVPSNRLARFSGKHAPHLLFALDEADAIPPEIFEAIESCMSGGFSRLLMMFNPRAEAGPVYQMERQDRAYIVRLRVFSHPNVITGEDVIPGSVDREKTVRRINIWTRPLVGNEVPDNECFELPDFLVGTSALDELKRPYPPLEAGWRKVMEPSFWYMVLGEYPAVSEMQLIPRFAIDAAQMRWRTYVATYGEIPPRDSKPVAGLDVSELGNDLNALTFRHGGYVRPAKVWNGVDPVQTGKDAAQDCINENASDLFVDANGVGAGTPRAARDAGFARAHRVMVSEAPPREVKRNEEEVECDKVRDLIAWRVREFLLKDKGAMLPPDPELRDELLAFKYHKNLKEQIKVSDSEFLRTKLRRSPDRFWSLALTFADGMDDDVPEMVVRSYIGKPVKKQRNGLGMENNIPVPRGSRNLAGRRN